MTLFQCDRAEESGTPPIQLTTIHLYKPAFTVVSSHVPAIRMPQLAMITHSIKPVKKLDSENL